MCGGVYLEVTCQVRDKLKFLQINWEQTLPPHSLSTTLDMFQFGTNLSHEFMDSCLCETANGAETDFLFQHKLYRLNLKQMRHLQIWFNH